VLPPTRFPNRIASYVGALALLASVVGCNRLPTDIRIDGSSTVFPLTAAITEEFYNDDPTIRMTVGFSGTGGGMSKFARGEVDICNASRRIKPGEVEALEAEGIAFIELAVAFDGLAVVLNQENDWCDCLTVRQLKELWRPESGVKRWSDLDSSWPESEIILYGPGSDSGTFDYFTEAIVGESKASRADYSASEDDNVTVTGVSEDKHALGYFGFAYYEENRHRLKLMKVDGGNGKCVSPSAEAVRDGTYQPLSRSLYVYVRKSALANPRVAKFVAFYLDTAANVASDVGYVPVSDEVHQKNIETLQAALKEVQSTSTIAARSAKDSQHE
jgi:phosphate transport system substrate-binding protein